MKKFIKYRYRIVVPLFIFLLYPLDNLLSAQNFYSYASAVWIEKGGSGTFYNTYSSSTTTSNHTYTAQENAINGYSGVWTSFLFQGYDFGASLCYSSKLLFRGCEVKTYKKNVGNVCSVDVYYVVYPKGSRPSTPVFSSSSISWFNNCDLSIYLFPDSPGHGPCNETPNYQKWQSGASGGSGHLTTNLVEDLTQRNEGQYTLELYYKLSGSNTSTTGCSDLTYDNNGASNYKADFTLCPTMTYTSKTDPATCGGTGSIKMATVGVADGTYSDRFYYDNTSGSTFNFANVTVASNVATVTGLPAGTYKNIRYWETTGCSPTSGFDVTLSDPAPPQISIDKATAICFGSTNGWIKVTATGGSGSYLFSKDDGATYTSAISGSYTFTHLAAGEYTIKVKDNVTGCEAACP